MESAQLRQLRERESALRAELMAVESALEQAINESAKPEESGERHLHHRPSWSMLGGTDGANQVPRSLGKEEWKPEAVLQNFPTLEVGPIGEFNHWDRRECRVQNPDAWKRSCVEYMSSIGSAAIPKVIHQIWVGPKEPPCLWLDTFRSDYLEAHPDWSYEIWSDERVAKLPMFNEKIYVEEKMWQCKADILRLEFLWHHGGVYVDADMISVGKKSLNPIVELGKDTGFVIAYEPDTKDKPYSILGNSVIACTPHHPLILMLILYLKQTFYQKRNHIEVFAVTGPVMYTKCLVDSGMPISIAAQELLYPAFHFVPNPDAIDFSRFPKCLMFQFGYTCSGLEGYVKRRNRCKRPKECPFHTKTPYLQSYKSLVGPDTPLYGQVPVALSYLESMLALPVPADGSFALEEGTAMFLVDGEMVQLVELRQQVAGFMNRVRNHPWDVLMLGMEWSTGADEVVLFNVPPGGRPRHCNCVALIVNVAGTKKMQVLRPTLQRCITGTGFDPTALFNAAGQLNLWFAAQKYPGTLEEARIWKSMPQVRQAFQQLAKHEPPLQCETFEVHGNLLKGSTQEGRMVFEMVLEPNGGIMFRSWNDDNSPNCEMKSAPGRVEWMKVFYNHQIVFEAQNKPIS